MCIRDSLEGKSQIPESCGKNNQSQSTSLSITFGKLMTDRCTIDLEVFATLMSGVFIGLMIFSGFHAGYIEQEIKAINYSDRTYRILDYIENNKRAGPITDIKFSQSGCDIEYDEMVLTIHPGSEPTCQCGNSLFRTGSCVSNQLPPEGSRLQCTDYPGMFPLPLYRWVNYYSVCVKRDYDVVYLSSGEHCPEQYKRCSKSVCVRDDDIFPCPLIDFQVVVDEDDHSKDPKKKSHQDSDDDEPIQDDIIIGNQLIYRAEVDNKGDKDSSIQEKESMKSKKRIMQKSIPDGKGNTITTYGVRGSESTDEGFIVFLGVYSSELPCLSPRRTSVIQNTDVFKSGCMILGHDTANSFISQVVSESAFLDANYILQTLPPKTRRLIASQEDNTYLISRRQLKLIDEKKCRDQNYKSSTFNFLYLLLQIQGAVQSSLLVLLVSIFAGCGLLVAVVYNLDDMDVRKTNALSVLVILNVFVCCGICGATILSVNHTKPQHKTFLAELNASCIEDQTYSSLVESFQLSMLTTSNQIFMLNRIYAWSTLFFTVGSIILFCLLVGNEMSYRLSLIHI
eukprot:TRINITY_DN11322_c0_g2_i3.p1 TRINITY_DN11322_c0_g2~~TRINITY_DN11322_c0_g2_i3.p1  ORF type:complete len:566 (+),score=50.72 TRINITY_DN11322_c0_g2_i3:65-1762(+)